MSHIRKDLAQRRSRSCPRESAHGGSKWDPMQFAPRHLSLPTFLEKQEKHVWPVWIFSFSISAPHQIVPGSSSCNVNCKVSPEIPSARTRSIIGGVVSTTQTPSKSNSSNSNMACRKLIEPFIFSCSCSFQPCLTCRLSWVFVLIAICYGHSDYTALCVKPDSFRLHTRPANSLSLQLAESAKTFPGLRPPWGLVADCTFAPSAHKHSLMKF